MKSFIILSLVLGSTVVFASKPKPLGEVEIDAVNFLLQCPDEVNELSKNGHRIQDGSRFSDKTVSDGRSYNFYRKIRWTSTEYVSTLTVTRVRRPDGPTDAPPYRVTCEITDKR